MASIAPFEVMEIQTLARELEAAGRDVIHLEIGEPDFRTPAPVVEAAQARARRAADVLHLRAGHPGAARGDLALLSRPLPRRGARRAHRRDRGLERGAAARLRRAARRGRRGAARRSGLSLQPPFRARARRRAAARARRRRTRATSSRPTLARGAWTPRTRIAMVASPSNPTGTMVEPGEIAALAALARERGATLLVDEIYHGLTYGLEARTALEAGEDVFVINSFSKYFQMTGWRLGWLVAPAGVRARDREARAEPLHLGLDARAARGAGGLRAGDDRDPGGAPPRARGAPRLPAAGARVPRLPRPGEAGGRLLRLRGLLARSPTTASPSRARCSRRRGSRSRPGKDFGLHQPERHIRIAYTQPVARLEEAVARLRAFLAARA